MNTATKSMSFWDLADKLKAEGKLKRYKDRYAPGEQEKRAGIELVYSHAPTEWKRQATEQLHEIIKKQQFFTSDDILIPLEAKGMVTKDNRAIAGILQAFNRSGLITSTETFVRCRRKSRHGAPIMQWKSNQYNKGEHNENI